MIFITPLEGTILLSASAEPQAKNESAVDTKASDAENSNIQDTDIPVAKMLYHNKSYEMSPFVVVENEDLKRVDLLRQQPGFLGDRLDRPELRLLRDLQAALHLSPP